VIFLIIGLLSYLYNDYNGKILKINNNIKECTFIIDFKRVGIQPIDLLCDKYKNYKVNDIIILRPIKVLPDIIVDIELFWSIIIVFCFFLLMSYITFLFFDV
jgi:hypothetical protein